MVAEPLKSIPIILDTPTPQPKLGFEKFANGISSAILGGCEEEGPFTVGLYGPWGTGKSSLLRKIESSLNQHSEWIEHSDSEETRMHVVYFDAWRHESADSLIYPLLAAITKQLRGVEKASIKDSAAAGFSEILSSLELSGWGFKLKSGAAPATKRESYYSPFDELAIVGDRLKKNNQRVLVLIDDLDRVSPNGVVGLIEALHVLTDIEGLVFVLALDYDYLTSAIQHHYPNADPHRFVEKIVQVPFHIPRASFVKTALQDLIPDWESKYRTWFTGSQGESLDERVEEIAQVALRSNPRQIKRLLNTFMLARYMAWTTVGEYGPEKLLALLGLQLSWPEQFRHLHHQMQEATRGNASRDGDLNLEDLPLYTEIVTREADSVDEEEEADFAAEISRSNSVVSVHDDESVIKLRELSQYFGAVLPPDTPVEALLQLTELAEQLSEHSGGSPEPVAVSAKKTQQEKVYDDSSAAVQRIVDRVRSYAVEKSGGSEEEALTSSDTRTAVRVVGNRLKRGQIAVTWVIRRRDEKALLYLPLDPDDLPMEEHGFLRNVTGKGHHGKGDVEITLTPNLTNESWSLIEEWIEESIETIRKRVN